MAQLAGFHNAHGRDDFLGVRTNADGAFQIVYDNGADRRLIWQVKPGSASENRIAEALRAAVDQLRVVPALYSELKKRAIAVDAVVR